MSTPSAKPKVSTGSALFDDRIQELVRDWGYTDNADLIAELITTVLEIARDEVPVADLKLYNRSLKEMRLAGRVFEPYRHVRKIAIFGSARTPPTAADYQAAEEYARLMREQGYMIITGAGDGIMGAAQRGAGTDHGFGLNIRLPFEQRANETIHGDPKLVSFNYFFTRKLMFLKETHAVALFPGGFGTMDEGFETLTLMQTGKGRILPLVLVDAPGGSYWETWMRFLVEYLLELGLISKEDFHLFKICHTVQEAVDEVIGFYKIFHSYRWVRDQLAIRINRPLTEEALHTLNEQFADLLASGTIIQGPGFREERNEPGLAPLPRIILRPHRHRFGRLRQLIDAINLSPTVAPDEESTS